MAALARDELDELEDLDEDLGRARRFQGQNAGTQKIDTQLGTVSKGKEKEEKENVEAGEGNWASAWVCDGVGGLGCISSCGGRFAGFACRVLRSAKSSLPAAAAPAAPLPRARAPRHSPRPWPCRVTSHVTSRRVATSSRSTSCPA